MKRIEIHCDNCAWYDGVICDKSGLRKDKNDVCTDWEREKPKEDKRND